MRTKSDEMTVTMKLRASDEDIKRVCGLAKKYNLKPKILYGTERNVIALIGDERDFPFEEVSGMSGVERATPILKPYKYVSRERHPENGIIVVNGVEIGGSELAIMAGPCSVEDEETTVRIAEEVRAAGADIFRGGAYKPRSSPHSFQGLREEGLEILKTVKQETCLPIVTEIMDIRDMEKIGEVTDIYQVGTRNMDHFVLLDELGKTRKPVLLKRGYSSTLEEWLLAAERIMDGGNEDIILCERGIRTFENYTRNTLDAVAIAAAKLETYLPVVADPSHGTGKRDLVYPASKISVAAGADGLLIEVHYNPDMAWSDKQQTIRIDDLKNIIYACKKIREVNGNLDLNESPFP